ncbi:MAG TPA: alpha-amylase family glycosyl hydrolase [Chitinophagaceae bacterium]
MKKSLFLFLLPLMILSCKVKDKDSGVASDLNHAAHPSWIMQGNIYEVNVRQYTPEGTFNAFAKHLDRLKEMGVQTLWFMPVHPISKTERKGTLGSYYAVANYREVNPEFGTLQDWKNLVNAAHEKGFKIIIDWVPNHTGADHPWLKTHSHFYIKDSTGKPTWKFDWTDIRVLDFNNKEMQDSMTSSMKFWVAETDIDGFRCDHTEDYQAAFWKHTISELNKVKKVFMLAEGQGSWIFDAGFHMDYGWQLFHTTKAVATGRRNALSIDSVLMKLDSTYPKHAMQMYFTSNHDENSWNKADYETMPGPVHAPFAVLSHTIYRGVPLIYSGQEEPVLRPLSFFEKDSVNFNKLSRAGFYKTLLTLRKNNQALTPDASFRKINVGDPKALYAYIREKDDKKIFVILNLSKKEQTIKVTDKGLHGNPHNIFMGTSEPLTDKEWKIEPWGYVVYEYPQTP